jgi:transcription antitermination factor NusG
LGLIMGGIQPARVPDAVIDEIRARERGGLVELPKRETLRAGETVRVVHGPLVGHLALYAGQRPRERVLVLLALLGGQQRVELALGDIEAL